MSTAERVNKLLKIKHLSKNELAKILGVPSATLYVHFKQNNQDYLTQYLTKISQYFPDISKQWLFFGEGEIYNDPSLNQIRMEEIQIFKTSLEHFENQIKIMSSELQLLKKQAELLENKIKNL